MSDSHTSDKGSERSSTDHGDDLFSSVDRSGLPNDDAKIQPWKNLDINLTEEWEPARWNIAGRAYQAILVHIGEHFTFMSGGTWYLSFRQELDQSQLLIPLQIRG